MSFEIPKGDQVVNVDVRSQVRVTPMELDQAATFMRAVIAENPLVTAIPTIKKDERFTIHVRDKAGNELVF